MKKKILVFAQSNVGGAERMTVTITKTLDESRFEVVYYLVDMIGDGKNALTDFIPKDKEVHILKRKHPLWMMLKFWAAIKREKPYLVFSSTLYLNNKILPWKRWFMKTKFVIRCENYLFTFNNKQKKLVAKTYNAADYIIAQTDEMRDELVNEAGVNKEKVVVLQNPIDKDTIDVKIKDIKNPYPDDGKIRFVATGRFTRQKGFDLLVDAFAELKKTLTDAKLVIIGNTGGDGNEYYAKLKEQIDRLGLDKDIQCVGYQDNPYKYMKYADCFVLSSRWEGLPNVLIEALYLGRPVASFRCIPIIDRIIIDGENGYKAEKEQPTSLTEAMLKAVQLKTIKNHYKSAEIENFHYLFEHCTKPPIR